MKKLIPILGFVGLAGCTTAQQGNVTACSAALFAANTSNPITLASIALATPACQGLAADIIQAILSRVSATQRARGIR